MMDKSTSDEKLLKLIEGSGASLKPAQKIGQKPKGKGLFPLPLKFNFKHSFNLHNMNIGLFVICGISTLSFLITIITGPASIKADLIFPSPSAGAVSKLTSKGGNGFLNIQEYLNEISKRNIFLPIEMKNATGQELTPDFSQLVQDLKLVGVIWSSNPEVMIESTKENRTYLLKKGDTFSKFKIKDITRSSAILEMDIEGKAKEYELR